MAKGDTKTNDYLDIAAHGERGDFPASCCETRSQTLIREVGERIMDLETEVQELENNPDVVDIVDTYADLTAYDTSGLTDKDVIRVITDETKGGLSSYYRWNSPDPGWNFVGVIPGGDGIKELSSADYNYPTGSPDRVALWLLDNGLYTAPAGVMVAASTTSYPWYNTSDKTILVGGSDTVKGIYTFLNGKVDVVTTQVSDGTEADEYTLLKSTQVLQATGQSTTDTMSQKAIMDAIADGGGVTELTTADYNANSNNWSDTDPANFNCIAYWKLDIGVYHHASGVRVATNTSTISSTHERMVIVSTKTSTEIHILYQSDNDAWQYGAVAPGGSGGYSPLPTAVVQTTGTSQTSVMSQLAVTNMVFADPSTKLKIRIGQSGAGVGTQSIAIGNSASATNAQSVALGYNSQSTGYNSVALGYGSIATSKGQFDVGTGTYTTAGYNDSNYRLLTGLYDGQSAHDAATKGQLDSIAIKNAGAPTTATEGTVGQLLEDTTNGKLYICTVADTVTPSYTWVEVGAGGGSEFTILTDSDANYTDPDSGDEYIALWLLPTGKYMLDENATVPMLAGMMDDGTGTGTLFPAYFYGVELSPVAFIRNDMDPYATVDITMYGSGMGNVFHPDYTTGEIFDLDTRNFVGPFVGADEENNGMSGLVPAPMVGQQDFVLAGNGSWQPLPASPEVVQTTGISTTDVMSQNATGSMIFSNPILCNAIRIGKNAVAASEGMVAIGGVTSGNGARVTGTRGIAIGANATSSGANGLAFGQSSTAGFNGSIALGAGSSTTAQGEVNIGLESATAGFQSVTGYNGSAYRLLAGVYDPQSAHDAATKGYVDPTTDSSAPTTATVGRLGQIQIDTTTNTAYMCVAVDDVTPTYTWRQITA